MRRALILLALLAVGAGRAGEADLLAVDGRHEIVAGGDRSGAALERPAGPAVSRVPVHGAGAGPRSSSVRPDLPAPRWRLYPGLAARQRALESRTVLYRRYAGALALARAGFHAFHISTPPPFPLN